MSNSKERFIPSYNPVPLSEIANAIGFSTTTFWRWRKKHQIELPAGRVDCVHQKLIYQKVYGEEYRE